MMIYIIEWIIWWLNHRGMYASCQLCHPNIEKSSIILSGCVMSHSLCCLMKSENISHTRTFSHKLKVAWIHSLSCLLICIFSVCDMSLLWWLCVSTWMKTCACASWATGARVSLCFIMIIWWVPWLHLGTDHKAAVLHLLSETHCSPSLLRLFMDNTQRKKQKYDVNKLTKGLICIDSVSSCCSAVLPLVVECVLYFECNNHDNESV